jgi:S-adenosylmethionine:tRNA ribosyltransferase-isomerase
MEKVVSVKRLSAVLATADFDFALPVEQIAMVPAPRRDGSRLLVLERPSGAVKHGYFKEILHFLPPRSLLVLNDTRVIPARLRGHKPTGGAVELLLTRSISPTSVSGDGRGEAWEALARGLGKVQLPLRVDIDPRLGATVIERLGGGAVVVRLETAGSLLEVLEEVGEVPLPPYIEAARRRAGSPVTAADDRARYQTVYAAQPGAVAAPTAGLHFTPELLDEIRAAGHDTATITLHVGPGTFRPVEVEDPRAHRMDVEHYRIPAATAAALAAARAEGRPVIAVGTTVVRALEAAARAAGAGGAVAAGEGATDLMLLPGDPFLVVTGLVTNFHLPRSTLLMLVAAFAGRDKVLAAYADAIARGYRFYSYGDAMLICEARA